MYVSVLTYIRSRRARPCHATRVPPSAASSTHCSSSCCSSYGGARSSFRSYHAPPSSPDCELPTHYCTRKLLPHTVLTHIAVILLGSAPAPARAHRLCEVRLDGTVRRAADRRVQPGLLPPEARAYGHRHTAYGVDRHGQRHPAVPQQRGQALPTTELEYTTTH